MSEVMNVGVMNVGQSHVTAAYMRIHGGRQVERVS